MSQDEVVIICIFHVIHRTERALDQRNALPEGCRGFHQFVCVT
jgi:hypothetical protein